MNADLPPTERADARSAGLDLLNADALVELLVADQREAVEAVFLQRRRIAEAVEAIAERLSCGGRLHYVGAGSSGRIAALDAAEMPPTFGTDPALVHAHHAGGAEALVRSVEGAEDDAPAGEAAMRECVVPGDVAVGISASGSARFVVAAIECARRLGASTLAITAVGGSPLDRAAGRTLLLETGAELLAGSTRMKAGTAQKICLNAISTAVMVRLGKVHENLMVDLVATNAKLRARAERLVSELAGVDRARAHALLEAAHGSVKVAVVMERRGVGEEQARAMLAGGGAALRRLI